MDECVLEVCLLLIRTVCIPDRPKSFSAHQIIALAVCEWISHTLTDLIWKARVW